jgi:hypothetical protein
MARDEEGEKAAQEIPVGTIVFCLASLLDRVDTILHRLVR